MACLPTTLFRLICTGTIGVLSLSQLIETFNLLDFNKLGQEVDDEWYGGWEG